ncbi:unnamed protein product [Rotaria sp. Silwood2]|nr:unnamed protein product [Rotaria sp. Silwood2]CAF4604447.1 unnamed protein product [Rotaria sp. Silwood2]
MENKTFLSAMLYFHKVVFKEQYDPFMVLAHVCLLKEKFIISNVAEEVKEILPLNQRTPQNLQVCYKKGDIYMAVMYAIDQKDFYMTLKINERKSSPKLLHTANYINEGKFYDEEELMKIILEYINTSLDDYQKTQGDSKGAKVPGGGQAAGSVKVPGGGLAAGSVKVPGGDKGVECLKTDTSFNGDNNNTISTKKKQQIHL